MTIEAVKDISGEVFKTLLTLASPILLVSMIVGLLVSFFQAITQLQEFTLTFVPKVVAVFLCIFILLPWFAKIMITFTTHLIERMPMYVR
ncbi:MAG: flagellar biosynthesis protein FliQ [Nitrospirae bacterium]|nr:flagellar biosynthesis protein FliQ [Nitrospirota bacterium]MBF0520983.1 flagellar biosynthesis protein FliQ [Nitrospirota bacterium]MBF0535439.1 flagellar biosynthesis protein FliQ [Nitrospirota bacterium]MBF0617627.1 flagellar biosynthesis protein FliQ [Nitrospirota bacterium]